MKKWIQRALLWGLLLGYWGAYAPADGAVLVTTGIRCDAFAEERSGGAAGQEVTIPMGLVYDAERLSISVETAYSSVTLDAENTSKRSLAGLTDTLLSTSYTFVKLPVDLVMGLDINLPTGKENLSEAERRTEFGENNDLLEVDDFGQGLNMGLSLGVFRVFQRLQLGLTGAYIFNGEFDPTSEIANDDFDPGDQALLIALLDWQATSACQLVTFAAYTHFSPDTVQGDEIFQEGASFATGIDVRVDLYPLEFLVSVQDVIQGKNEELLGASLEPEPSNSNANTVYGLLDVMYVWSPELTLELLADVRYYAESERKIELSGRPYQGRRIRYAVGPGVIYDLNDRFSVNALAKYVNLNQEKGQFFDNDTTYHGLDLDFGLMYIF